MLDYEELRRSSAMAEEREEALEGQIAQKRALGPLSAPQRLILALLFFLDVTVLGLLLLVATNRVAIPI
jgi:hypothetical protein